MALEQGEYRDPFLVVSDRESGDVMPRKRRVVVGCLACSMTRPGIYEWPCKLGNMPSPFTGTCRCWRPINEQ